MDKLPPHSGCEYEIRVEGCLTEDWSEWFEGLSIQAQDGSVTVLRGWLPDQSALLGVLYKMHGLNLSLVSVTRFLPVTPPRGS
jgi:hypothetical protein